jgi:hypothetical protein
VTLPDRIASIPFRRLIWLVPIALAFHEAEEWNIMPWWMETFSNATVVSDLALRTWLVVITLFGFLWTGLGCLLPTARATALMVLPFFILVVLSNALQHAYWQFAFDGYAPAFLSCALFNIPAVLLISWHALRNRLVGPVFIGVLYVALVPSLVLTIRSGHTEPPFFNEMLRFGARLAEVLFGAV